MIELLKLGNIMKKHSEKFGEKNGKVMTATLLEHLRTKYPAKANEYKLIYMKAERFLAE
jgi:hypothetical protein